MAIPNKAKKINIPHSPVVFHYFRDTSYSLGITKVKIAGKEVRVYDKEKTAYDCFKNISYVTEEIALEAQKDYLKLKDRNIITDLLSMRRYVGFTIRSVPI